MVAVITGSGLGLLDSSLNTLGAHGVQGNAAASGLQGAGLANAGSTYVNAATGNLIIQSLDEQLSGTGLDAAFIRTYNSRGLLNDSDGDNWRHSGERSLDLSNIVSPLGSTITRIAADGSETRFAVQGDGSYLSTEGSGAHDSLLLVERAGQNVWQWQEGSSQVKEFYEQSTGRLLAIEDTSGNAIEYAYDGSDRLQKITDINSDQSYTLSYNADGQLESIATRTLSTEAAIRQAHYEYDTEGRLSRVSIDLTPEDDSIADAIALVTEYGYEDDTSHRVTSVTRYNNSDIADIFLNVSYDANGRVQTVTDTSGTTTFDYSLANTTVVTNAEGNAWSYTFDAEQQLIRRESSLVNGVQESSVFTYNPEGDVVQVQDGRGNQVRYFYDENGNRLMEVDSEGNVLTRLYTEANQLLKESQYTQTHSGALPAVQANPGDTLPVLADDVLSSAISSYYVYDDAQRLRFVVSAEGRISENRYNAFGQLQASIVYQNDAFGGDAPLSAAVLEDESLALTSAVAWTEAATTDLSQTTLSEYGYDYRGNLQSQTQYASVGSDGVGILDSATTVSEFIYSAHGQLLETISVHGTERITTNLALYDGAGRLTSTTDGNGTSTTVYNGATRQIQVSNEAGLTTIQNYDARGKLLNIEQTDGTANRTTRYAYDSAGRLRMTEDAEGARSWLFYDAAGRVAYSVDAEGVVTGFDYNANGQVATETNYATAIDSTTRDTWFSGSDDWESDASILVDTLDVTADPTHDRSVSYIYDDAGRLLQQQQAGISNASISEYDGASRLIQSEFGDRISHVFYDDDGLQIGSVDAEGAVVENIYDDLGRLIQTRQYSIRIGDEALGDTLNETLSTALADRNFMAITEAFATFESLNNFFYYDNQGRQIGQVNEQGFLTTTSYNITARQQVQTVYIDPVSVSSGDSLAVLLSRLSSSDTYVTTTTFDEFGRVDRISETNGRTQGFHYDDAGRLTRTIAGGEVAGEITEDPRAIYQQYNAFNEVTGTVSGVGAAGLVVEPEATDLQTAIDNDGNSNTFDKLGRITSTTDALGNTNYFYYDSLGRVTHTVNAMGEVTETTYTTFGQVDREYRYTNRLSETQLANVAGGTPTPAFLSDIASLRGEHDSEMSYTYTQFGAVETATDERGYITHIDHNAFGEAESETQAFGLANAVTNTFARDKFGRVTDTVWAFGADEAVTMHTQFDAFGRVVLTTDGRDHSRSITYLDGGRAVETVDALERSSTSVRDALGRDISVTGTNGFESTFTHLDTARSMQAMIASGQRETTYNLHGEMHTTDNGRGGVSRTEYNADGQVIALYDFNDELIESRGYYANALLQYTIDANGVGTDYTYDAANRLETVVVDPEGLALTTTYTYDGQGRQLSVTESGAGSMATRVTEYGYYEDGSVRLVVVDRNNLRLATSYTYDEFGNVATMAQGTVSDEVNIATDVVEGEDARVTRYEYDSLQRRTREIVDPDGLNLTTEYRYDANGNVTRRIDGTGDQAVSTWFVYDAENQITHTVNALGFVTENQYASNGQVAYTRQYYERIEPSTLGDAIDLESVTFSPDDSRDLQSYRVFDTANRERFTLTYAESEPGEITSGKWVVTENRYDNSDNLIETLRHDQYLSYAQIQGLISTLEEGRPVDLNAEDVDDLVYEAYTASDLGDTQRTHFVYDMNNRLRFTIDGERNVIENRYDTFGNVTSVLEYTRALSALPNNAVTYDYPFVAEVITALGVGAEARTTHFAYDDAGRQSYVVDSLNQVSLTEYNIFGDVSRTTRFAQTLSAATEISHENISSTVNANDGENRVEEYLYDSAGRQTFVKNAGGFVTRTDYDDFNQVISQVRFGDVAPESLSTTQVAYEEEFSQLDTDSRVNYFAYDKAGRQTFSVDRENHITRNEYDSLGRVVKTTQYAEPVLTNNSHEQLVFVTEAISMSANDANRTTEYVYDALGRVRYQIEGSTAITRNVYDAFGRLTGAHQLSPTAYNIGLSGSEAVAKSIILDYVVPDEELIEARIQQFIDRAMAFGNVQETSANDVYSQSWDRLNFLIYQFEQIFNIKISDTPLPGNRDGRMQITESYVYDHLTPVQEGEFFTYGDNHSEETYRSLALSLMGNHEPKVINSAALQALLSETLDELPALYASSPSDEDFQLYTAKQLSLFESALDIKVDAGIRNYLINEGVFALRAAENNQTIFESHFANLVEEVISGSHGIREYRAAYADQSRDEKIQQYIAFALGLGAPTSETNFSGRGQDLVDYAEMLFGIQFADNDITHADGSITRGKNYWRNQLATLHASQDTHTESFYRDFIENALHVNDGVGISEDAFADYAVTLGNISEQYETGDLLHLISQARIYLEQSQDIKVGQASVDTWLDNMAQHRSRVNDPSLTSPWASDSALYAEMYQAFMTNNISHSQWVNEGNILPDRENYGLNPETRQSLLDDAVEDSNIRNMSELFEYNHYRHRVGEIFQQISLASGMRFTEAQYDYATTAMRDYALRLHQEGGPSQYGEDRPFYEKLFADIDNFIALANSTENALSTRSKLDPVYLAMGSSSEQRSLEDLDNYAQYYPLGIGETRGQNFEYDALGRLVRTTDAMYAQENYSYDALGNRESYTDKNNNTWNYEYDSLGRLTREISPEVEVGIAEELRRIASDTEYDVFGNVSKRTEGIKLNAAEGTEDLGEARTTHYFYDNLDRQTYSIDALRYVDQMEYNRFGDMVKTTRFSDTLTSTHTNTQSGVEAFLQARTETGQDRSTEYVYDTLGRRVYTIEGGQKLMRTDYNAFGDVVQNLEYDLDVSELTGGSNSSGGGGESSSGGSESSGSENSNFNDIAGSYGWDNLAGTSGDDAIVGWNGRDYLYGQDGDDLLYGHDDDRLYGGLGSDTYYFNSKKISAQVYDLNYEGDVNTIFFGGDIVVDDLTFAMDREDLKIYFDEDLREGITVVDFYNRITYEYPNEGSINGSHAHQHDPNNPIIDQIVFADGTYFNADDILAMTPTFLDIYGGEVTALLGTSGNDHIATGERGGYFFYNTGDGDDVFTDKDYYNGTSIVVIDGQQIRELVIINEESSSNEQYQDGLGNIYTFYAEEEGGDLVAQIGDGQLTLQDWSPSRFGMTVRTSFSASPTSEFDITPHIEANGIAPKNPNPNLRVLDVPFVSYEFAPEQNETIEADIGIAVSSASEGSNVTFSGSIDDGEGGSSVRTDNVLVSTVNYGGRPQEVVLQGQITVDSTSNDVVEFSFYARPPLNASGSYFILNPGSELIVTPQGDGTGGRYAQVYECRVRGESSEGFVWENQSSFFHQYQRRYGAGEDLEFKVIANVGASGSETFDIELRIPVTRSSYELYDAHANSHLSLTQKLDLFETNADLAPSAGQSAHNYYASIIEEIFGFTPTSSFVELLPTYTSAQYNSASFLVGENLRTELNTLFQQYSNDIPAYINTFYDIDAISALSSANDRQLAFADFINDIEAFYEQSNEVRLEESARSHIRFHGAAFFNLNESVSTISNNAELIAFIDNELHSGDRTVWTTPNVTYAGLISESPNTGSSGGGSGNAGEYFTLSQLNTLLEGRVLGEDETRGESYEYDSRGHLVGMTDALGQSESYAYDAFGNRTSFTNKKGDTWNYEFDVLNRLTREVTPEAALQVKLDDGTSEVQTVRTASTVEYDNFGNVRARTEGIIVNESGPDNLNHARTTEYLYDELNRQTRTIEAGFYDETEGRFYRENNDAQTRVQRSTRVIYDAMGRAIANHVNVGEDSFVSQFKTYDALGRVSYEVDANDYVSGYAYNAFGEQVQVTRFAEGIHVDASADHHTLSQGEIETQLANNVHDDDRQITTVYDQLGRKFRILQDAVETYSNLDAEYYAHIPGQVVQASPEIEYEYNAFGQVSAEHIRVKDGGTRETDPERWNSKHRRYDNLGRERFMQDALGYVTENEYDVFGNLQKTTEYADPVSSMIGYDLDAISIATNERDRITGYSYDELNRQTETRLFNVTYEGGEPVPRDDLEGLLVSENEYDVLGNITATVDALGNRTEYVFNTLGYINTVIQPERLAVTAELVSVAAYGSTVHANSNDPFRDGSQGNVTPQTDYVLDVHGNIVREEIDDNNADGKDIIRLVTREFDFLGNEILNVDAKINAEAANETDAKSAGIHREFDIAGRIRVERQQVIADNVAPERQYQTGVGSELTYQDASGAYHYVLSATPIEGANSIRLLGSQYWYAEENITDIRVLGAENYPDVRPILGLNAEDKLSEMRIRVERHGETQTEEYYDLDVRSEYHYDATGNQTARLDVYNNGESLRRSGQYQIYNAFGETEQTYQIDASASSNYTALADPTRSTYGSTTTATLIETVDYDKAGRIASKRAMDGVTRYYYDLAGNATAENKAGDAVDPSNPEIIGTGNRWTEWVRDIAGRVVEERLPGFEAYADIGNIDTRSPRLEWVSDASSVLYNNATDVPVENPEDVGRVDIAGFTYFYDATDILTIQRDIAIDTVAGHESYSTVTRTGFYYNDFKDNEYLYSLREGEGTSTLIYDPDIIDEPDGVSNPDGLGQAFSYNPTHPDIRGIIVSHYLPPWSEGSETVGGGGPRQVEFHVIPLDFVTTEVAANEALSLDPDTFPAEARGELVHAGHTFYYDSDRWVVPPAVVDESGVVSRTPQSAAATTPVHGQPVLSTVPTATHTEALLVAGQYTYYYNPLAVQIQEVTPPDNVQSHNTNEFVPASVIDDASGNPGILATGDPTKWRTFNYTHDPAGTSYTFTVTYNPDHPAVQGNITGADLVTGPYHGLVMPPSTVPAIDVAGLIFSVSSLNPPSGTYVSPEVETVAGADFLYLTSEEVPGTGPRATYTTNGFTFYYDASETLTNPSSTLSSSTQSRSNPPIVIASLESGYYTTGAPSPESLRTIPSNSSWEYYPGHPDINGYIVDHSDPYPYNPFGSGDNYAITAEVLPLGQDPALTVRDSLTFTRVITPGYWTEIEWADAQEVYDNLSLYIQELPTAAEYLSGMRVRVSEPDSSLKTTVLDLVSGFRVQRVPDYELLEEYERSIEGMFNEFGKYSALPTTEREYDRWGNVTSKVDAAGYQTLYEYNYADKLSRETAVDITIVDKTQSNDVQVVEETVSRHHDIYYDILGRAVRETDSVSREGVAGEELVRSRSKEFNNVGQLIVDEDATENKTEYAYDAFGNMVGKKKGYGHVYINDYDQLGNITDTYILRLESGEEYTHLDNFEDPELGVYLAPYVDAHHLTHFDYDNMGRRFLERHTADESDVNGAKKYVEYDERGNIKLDSHFGNEMHFVYDAFNRKVSEYKQISDTERLAKSWDYLEGAFQLNILDNMTSGMQVDGEYTESAVTRYYGYNDYAQMLTEAVGDRSSNPVRTYDYFDNGLVKSIFEDYVSEIEEEVEGTTAVAINIETERRQFFDYDQRGLKVKEHVVEESVTNRMGEWVERLAYISPSDPAFGQKTIHVWEASESPRYQSHREITYTTYSDYDELGRLVRVESPAETITPGSEEEVNGEFVTDLEYLRYGYDAVGNREYIASFARPPALNLGTNGRINDPHKWFSYDAEGRVLIEGGSVDAENNQVVATDLSKAYTYDKSGRVRNTAEIREAVDHGPYTTTLDLSLFVEENLPGYEFISVRDIDNTNFAMYYNPEDPAIRGEILSAEVSTLFGGYHVVIDPAPVPAATATHSVSYDDLDRQIAGISDSTGAWTAKYNNRGFQIEFDGRGGRTESRYGADGRLLEQVNYTPTGNKNVTLYNLENSYDQSGNLKHYQVVNYESSGAVDYRLEYRNEYDIVNGEYRVISKHLERGEGAPSSIKPSASTFVYDFWGNNTKVYIGGDNGGEKTFIYDGQGRILSALEEYGDLDDDTGQFEKTKATSYFYQGSNYLGSAWSERIIHDEETVRSTGYSARWDTGSDFSNGVTHEAGPMPGSYTITGGETLQSIAFSVFGDASLWYVIAEANSLQKGPSDLFSQADVGRTLIVPNVPVTLKNNATTFKPYNPGEIIGDTTPTMTVAPPSDKGCNTLALIVIVIIAVVVTVFTAGAAAMAMGATATAAGGGGVMAIGAAALTGGGLVGAGVGVGMAAAAVGGFVGSVASQLVGKELGVVESFSLRQAVASGIGAGLTAGAGALANSGNTGLQVLGYAGQSMSSYAANKIAGLDASFSWRTIVAQEIGSMVGQTAGKAVGQMTSNTFAKSFVSGAIAAGTAGHINRKFNGGGKVDMARIATDAFANALASEIKGAMTKDSQSERVNEALAEMSAKEKQEMKALEERNTNQVSSAADASIEAKLEEVIVTGYQRTLGDDFNDRRELLAGLQQVARVRDSLDAKSAAHDRQIAQEREKILQIRRDFNRDVQARAARNSAITRDTLRGVGTDFSSENAALESYSEWRKPQIEAFEKKYGDRNDVGDIWGDLSDIGRTMFGGAMQSGRDTITGLATLASFTPGGYIGNKLFEAVTGQSQADFIESNINAAVEATFDNKRILAGYNDEDLGVAFGIAGVLGGPGIIEGAVVLAKTAGKVARVAKSGMSGLADDIGSVLKTSLNKSGNADNYIAGAASIVDRISLRPNSHSLGAAKNMEDVKAVLATVDVEIPGNMKISIMDDARVDEIGIERGLGTDNDAIFSSAAGNFTKVGAQEVDQLQVLVKRSVLESDEKIVWVFTHEVDELDFARSELLTRVVTPGQFKDLTRPKNSSIFIDKKEVLSFHNQAVETANDAVLDFRRLVESGTIKPENLRGK